MEKVNIPGMMAAITMEIGATTKSMDRVFTCGPMDVNMKESGETN